MSKKRGFEKSYPETEHTFAQTIVVMPCIVDGYINVDRLCNEDVGDTICLSYDQARDLIAALQAIVGS